MYDKWLLLLRHHICILKFETFKSQKIWGKENLDKKIFIMLSKRNYVWKLKKLLTLIKLYCIPGSHWCHHKIFWSNNIAYFSKMSCIKKKQLKVSNLYKIFSYENIFITRYERSNILIHCLVWCTCTWVHHLGAQPFCISMADNNTKGQNHVNITMIHVFYANNIHQNKIIYHLQKLVKVIGFK